MDVSSSFKNLQLFSINSCTVSKNFIIEHYVLVDTMAENGSYGFLFVIATLIARAMIKQGAQIIYFINEY